MSTGGLESLRGRNRQAVVAAVQAHPGASRAQVARITGLSTTTVSTLVAELIAGRVLLELGTVRTGGGRPSIRLGIDPSVGAVVGIHLGHADLRVMVTSLDGALLAEQRHELDVDHQPAQSLERVAATTVDLLGGLDVAPDRVLGLGVAVSAPVLGSRSLASPPMLLDWGGVDIIGRLSRAADAPVHLGNDATLGALAEWRLGAGVGTDDLLYVMLSEGVGAGLVLRSRLHRGATGTAGEFGHLPVVADGPVCRCGARGCLETVVGKRALVTALAHTRGPECTVEQLLDLAEQGDRGAMRLLSDAGQVVGTTLAGVCTMIDPTLVVLGGDLASRPAAGEALVRSAQQALSHALPPVANHRVRVVRAALGSRAEALGAALLAASRAKEKLAGFVTVSD
jgi:predicted NBD/HSP70 family sugar kinase